MPISVICEVGELGQVLFELQDDFADRPVALFADDYFGQAMHFFAGSGPFCVVIRAFARLGAFEVIVFAEDEQNLVCVLLDGARFAQVRELRALVFARLHLTRELRQGDDGNIQFLRE